MRSGNMKKFFPSILLFSAIVFLVSTITEPLLVRGDALTSFDDFEEEFFNDELPLEDLTFDDLEKMSEDELEEFGINTDEDAEKFNTEILDEDFDFEAAVNDLDIAKMDKEERDEFQQVIEEVAATSGSEEVELLEEALIDIFDSDSETFNDLEATQENLEEAYVEKLESEEIAFLSKTKKLIFGSNKVYAAKKKKGKIRVGVNLAGSVINVAIIGVVGGGVSALKSYIKKKGKKVVAKNLSRVATAQAKKIKIKSVRGVAIATVISSAIYVALDYLDVGVALARVIDSKDWYRNNGWIDITK